MYVAKGAAEQMAAAGHGRVRRHFAGGGRQPVYRASGALQRRPVRLLPGGPHAAEDRAGAGDVL